MIQEDSNNSTDSSLTKAERKQQRRQEKREAREREQRRQHVARGTRWFLVLLGVGLVVAALVYGPGRGSSDGAATQLNTDVAADTDWVRGPEMAAATLVEYGDFQCPACKAFHPTVQQLAEELGDDLRVVYRHFPLRQPHPQAELAARASEAAGRQGKFWEMHDLLFDRQSEWSGQRDARDRFVSYAGELGLDQGQFETDIDDDAVADAVDEDYRSGVAAGVNSTPTFYLNGEEVQGFSTYDEFEERVREAATPGT